MKARGLVLAVAGLLAAAPPLHAEGLTLAAFGGYFDMLNAKDSAKAVFDGSSGGVTYGGEVGYRFKHHFSVTGRVDYFKKDGERVFVASPGAPVFPLGHPLSVKILPFDLNFGYHFGDSALRPYVGAGAGLVSYKEESTVAGVTTSNSETKFGARFFAGAEYGRGAWRFAAEAAYSLVPDTIGLGGVSQIYGEKDIGGVTVVGKVIFFFGK